MKGVQVSSSDDCKCRVLFPSLCRGTVRSRYNVIERNKNRGNFVENPFPVETVVFSSIGVVLLCAIGVFLFAKKFKPRFRPNRFSMVELGENLSGSFNSASENSVSGEFQAELESYHALE